MNGVHVRRLRWVTTQTSAGRWITSTMLAGAMAGLCGLAIPLTLVKHKRRHVAFGLVIFACKFYATIKYGWAESGGIRSH